MPLWTSLFRPLVCKRSLQRCARTSKTVNQWQRGGPAWRSYSTSLQESHRDEVPWAPFAAHGVDIKTPDESQGDGVVSRGRNPDWMKRKIRSRFHADGERNKTIVNQNVVIEPPSSTPRRTRAAHVRRVEAFQRPRRALRAGWQLVSLSRLKLPASRTRTGQLANTRRNHHQVQRMQKLPGRQFPVWSRQVNRIGGHVNPKHPHTYLKEERKPIVDVRAFTWTEAVLDRLDDGELVIRSGDLLDMGGSRNYVWNQVALWLLSYDQKNMVRFLLATHVEPYRPTVYIDASLLHLARHWAHSTDPDAALYMQRLADAFVVLADRGGSDGLNFHDVPFIRILLPYCTDDQIRAMHSAVKSHRVQLGHDAYLHFATYFAKNGHFELALKALSSARDAGSDVNSYPFRSNCSTILRAAMSEPDGLRATLRIVSDLVDMGVQLDNPICDIIMLNAIEAGDLKTAFAVHHSLVERGLKPTESTFMVLLKGCSLNIDDAEMLNNVIRDAIANINVRESSVVATEILHCLALHHSQHQPSTALKTLTEAYAQLFDLTPLQKLGLPLHPVSQPPSPTLPVMPPTRHALTFVIGAWITHHLSVDETATLYNHWRALISQNADHYLSDLASTGHLANIFLTSFIRTVPGLLHAAHVIRDMQNPLPPSCTDINGLPIQQCKPNVHNYSVFLHGFTRHGKTALAEQVLAHMRKQGLKPNVVTWNTLVAGYARAQDVSGAVGAMDRMRDEGWEWDHWTYGGLKSLKGHYGPVGGAKVDFSRELKKVLGERLEREGVARLGFVEAESGDVGRVESEFGKESKDGSAEEGESVAVEEDSESKGEFADSPAEIAEQTTFRPL